MMNLGHMAGHNILQTVRKLLKNGGPSEGRTPDLGIKRNKLQPNLLNYKRLEGHKKAVLVIIGALFGAQLSGYAAINLP